MMVMRICAAVAVVVLYITVHVAEKCGTKNIVGTRRCGHGLIRFAEQGSAAKLRAITMPHCEKIPTECSRAVMDGCTILTQRGGAALLIGILCISVASLLFGLIPSVNKYVLLSGMPSECIIFFAHGMVAMGAASLALLSKNSIRLPIIQAGKLLFLGAIGMGATSFFINRAAETIPVGIVTTLHFLYPTIVSLVMVLIYHQTLTCLNAVSMVLSICGMLLITNINEGGVWNQLGILAALCSSCTYAFYIICNDRGGVNSLPLSVRLFYSALGSATVFGLLSLKNGAVRLPHSTAALLALVLGSGLGSLVAFYFITAGIQRVGATTAAFTNMLEPVVSVIFSTIYFHDTLSPGTALGMCIILLSIFLIAMDRAKHKFTSFR